LLAKRVVHRFGDQVRYQDENFGDSELGDRLGVKQYPAVFIDDVLVATPRDFWEWGGKRGRYTPWKDAASRQRFEDDLTRMLELRLNNERLEGRVEDHDDGFMATIDRLPEVSMTDLAGRELRTAELAGRVVLVEFWATWCPPCQGTIDWLHGLEGRFGEGLEVLALAVQSEEDAVWAMTPPAPTRTRVVLAEPELAGAFGGVMAVPTLMVFDRRGKLTSVFYGAPPDLGERVEAVLAELMGTKKGENDALR
jgi:thiol-disulfide isomerase/thioredoxin